MKKRQFHLPSSDGSTILHGLHWIPDGPVRGVLQITHGMVENMDRYEDVAEYMVQAGFAVLGHDHLGHGDSVKTQENRGYFADREGDICLVKDLFRVTALAKREHPDVPVFILGHSMGSFVLRRALTSAGDLFAGAILSGTGNISLRETNIGLFLARILEKGKKGRRLQSRFLNAVSVGRYIFRFQIGRGRHKGSWLSKNEESVRQYRADPRCQFIFTVGAYEDLFSILRDLAQGRDFDRIPRELPVLFLSGVDDSLGGYTKRVLEVYNRFVEMGMKDVDLRFYRDDRHEVLHETDRSLVYADLLGWMEERMGAVS